MLKKLEPPALTTVLLHSCGHQLEISSVLTSDLHTGSNPSPRLGQRRSQSCHQRRLPDPVPTFENWVLPISISITKQYQINTRTCSGVTKARQLRVRKIICCANIEHWRKLNVFPFVYSVDCQCGARRKSESLVSTLLHLAGQRDCTTWWRIWCWSWIGAWREKSLALVSTFSLATKLAVSR